MSLKCFPPAAHTVETSYKVSFSSCYRAFFPLCRKVCKTNFWNVPLAGGLILQLPTAQAGPRKFYWNPWQNIATEWKKHSVYLRKPWLLISLIRILIIFLSDKLQHYNRFLLYYSLSIPWETRARGDSAFIEAGMAALQTWRISASSFQTNILSTGRLDRMSGRKWRETKQSQVTRSGHQISCCSVSLHFLWDILSTGPV